MRVLRYYAEQCKLFAIGCFMLGLGMIYREF